MEGVYSTGMMDYPDRILLMQDKIEILLFYPTQGGPGPYGPVGPPGAQGPRGPTGMQGEKGEQGYDVSLE